MAEELAELDLRIIEALIKEPRRSYRSLGEDLDVSQQYIARRVSFLIENEILRITVQKDFEAAGAHFPAHVDVYVAHGRKEDVAQALAGLDEVTNCLITAGRPEVIIRTATRNQKHFVEFMQTKVTAIEGIERTETLTVLNIEKYNLHYASIDL